MAGLLMGAIAGAAKGFDDAYSENRKERLAVEAEGRKEASALRVAQGTSDIELGRQKALALFQSGIAQARENEILGISSGGAGAPGAIAQASGTPSTTAAGGAPAAPTTAEGRTEAITTKLQALADKYNVPVDALRWDLAKNGGKKIAEMLKEGGTPDWHISGNFAVDKKKLKEGGFIPGVQTSADGKTSVLDVGPDGKPRVSVPQGAAEAFGTYRGIEAGVKAASTPMKVYNPDTKREEFVTEADVVGRRGGGGAPTSPAPAQAARDQESLRIVQGELDTAKSQLEQATVSGDTAAQQRLQGDVDALTREVGRISKTAGAPAQPPRSGNFAAGPSASEEGSKDAQKGLNDNFVKNRLQPVLDAGDSAGSMLASIKATRIAMDGMGGTGWGVETRAKAASMLEGLGLAPERAKSLALSSQLFQNAAMARLQVTLNAAKGPQTEGDAARAAQTYASIGNVTQANKFILDLAEATAQREVAKARYYNRVLPVATERGDLGMIERSWLEQAPSIFDMPVMQRWGTR